MSRPPWTQPLTPTEAFGPLGRFATGHAPAAVPPPPAHLALVCVGCGAALHERACVRVSVPFHRDDGLWCASWEASAPAAFACSHVCAARAIDAVRAWSRLPPLPEAPRSAPSHGGPKQEPTEKP